MIMHRWQTLNQYVASTRIGLFGLGKGSEEEQAREEVQKVKDFVKEMQQVDKDEEEDKAGGAGIAERRKTVAALTTYHDKVGGHAGEEVNFEKQFDEKFLRPDAFTNPMMRRLSMRRGTMAQLENRRQSYRRQSYVAEENRRLSSFGLGGGGVSFGKTTSFSSASNIDQFDNKGYESDSALEDDFSTEFSGSSYTNQDGRRPSHFEVSRV